MASSSRTKKPRSSVSHSKQGTSTSKSNPLILTRLLANMINAMSSKTTFMDAQSSLPNTVKDIVLDTKIFSSLCCDIPNQGRTTSFGLVCEWDNYDRMEFYLSLCIISKEEIEQLKQQGFGETVKNKDILSAGYLKLEDRLLQYFLSYVILQKFSYHSQISDIELKLMYAMKFNIKINWAQMIMQQMWHVCDSQSPLPYAIFITKILEHFGVSLVGETKVALTLCESKIDVEVDSRLSERFSPERERLTWEGQILENRGRFSPEPELSRLGEKYHFGAVGTVRFSLERESLA
ncbi:hypothetical protein Lal_00039740 [Lupinus albus]|nr:hypothetical protein Lal_00039740 [Lupinus albus]